MVIFVILFIFVIFFILDTIGRVIKFKKDIKNRKHIKRLITEAFDEVSYVKDILTEESEEAWELEIIHLNNSMISLTCAKAVTEFPE